MDMDVAEEGGGARKSVGVTEELVLGRQIAPLL